MRPERLTRKERQALTRGRLMEAAAQVFAERGFYGAAIEEIVARAGYTRGAFFSNFADKEEVFLAVLDERTAEQIAEVGELVKAAASPEELFAALRERYRSDHFDETWSPLWAEFRLHALRNPAVRPRLAERERMLRKAYARAIAPQFEALGIDAPMPLEQLAIIVEALDSGFKMQRLIDPEAIPENFFVEVLAVLLQAVSSTAPTSTGARTVRKGPQKDSRTGRPSEQR